MNKIFVGLCSNGERNLVLERNFKTYLVNVLGVKNADSVIYSSSIRNERYVGIAYYDKIFSKIKDRSFVVVVFLINKGFKIIKSWENLAPKASELGGEDRCFPLLERGLDPAILDPTPFKGGITQYYEDYGALEHLGDTLFKKGLTDKPLKKIRSDLIQFCRDTQW